MEEYFYLAIVVCFLLLLTAIHKKLIVLPFLALALFSGFRYDVGIDYDGYQRIFEWGREGLNGTKEPLFIYFLKFCNYLGGTGQLMFLILSFITIYFVYKFIDYTSKDRILSFLLFFSIISFYLYTFNAIRQWTACSIYLFSLSLLFENKIKKFLIINIIAALFFHLSLLLIIPLTLLCRIDLSRFKKNVMLIGAFVAGALLKILVGFTAYDAYNAEGLEFDSAVDIKIYIFLLMSIVVEFIRKKFKKTKYSEFLFNINFISILLLIIIIIQGSGPLVLLIKRFHNYFLAIYIIIIPFLLTNVEESKRKAVSGVLYIVLPLLFLTTVYFLGESNNLLPFQFNFKLFN